MKHLTLLILTFCIPLLVIGQENEQIKTLITEGIKLQDASKHAEAIAKYQEALKLDPENPNANYEMAFTLMSTGAGKDAIPYLNKVTAGKSNAVARAYDMLGSIYDDLKETEKAIANFKLGIAANPDYQRIYYNLAITYSRAGRENEAVPYLVKALQMDPKHASSHRLYAMIMMSNPETRINALLAFCNFLLLEPTSQRSVAAYQDLQKLLNAGISRSEDGSSKVVLSSGSDPDQNAANLAISLSGQLDTVQNHAHPNEKLTEPERIGLQLKTIFNLTGELSAKRKQKDFFWSFYADRFNKLSHSDFMDLASRIITFTAFQEANKKWIADHQQDLVAFGKWQKDEF